MQFCWTLPAKSAISTFFLQKWIKHGILEPTELVFVNKFKFSTFFLFTINWLAFSIFMPLTCFHFPLMQLYFHTNFFLFLQLFINQQCLFTVLQLLSLTYYHAFSRNPIPVFVSLIWHACTFVLTFCNAHSYFRFLFISSVFSHWCLCASCFLLHTSCFLSCITESFSPNLQIYAGFAYIR